MAPPQSNFRYNSYGSYIGKTDKPEWLYTKSVLNMLGKGKQSSRYQSYVEKGVDEEKGGRHDLISVKF